MGSFETYNGRSAFGAGTAPHAPKLPFAPAVKSG
jgi:hypothetical protein